MHPSFPHSSAPGLLFAQTHPAQTRLYSDLFAQARLRLGLSSLRPFFTSASLCSDLCGVSFRKEVIQPHLPVRLPCYDFVPVIGPTLGSSLLAVRSPTSGVSNSHDVTGGVYKARERIHRSMADLRLLATPASCRRVAACNLNYERLWWDSLQVAPSLPIVPPIVACV